jgi:predicted DNA-binding protein YlxM (UPF0122 family)
MNVSGLEQVKFQFVELLHEGTYKHPAAQDTANTLTQLATIADILEMTTAQQKVRTVISNGYATISAAISVVASIVPLRLPHILDTIATMTDKSAVQYLLTHLENGTYLIPLVSLIQLITIAPNGSKQPTESVITARYTTVSNIIWRDLMKQLCIQEDIAGYFAENVSTDIVLNIAKCRTGKEMDYLSQQDIEILRAITADLAESSNAKQPTISQKEKHDTQMQILNLTHDELVSVIVDMNNIAREASKKQIGSCMKKLESYSKGDRLVTKNQERYGGMNPQQLQNLDQELKRLAKLTNRYRDTSNYFLKPTTADDVEESKLICTSNTNCVKSIDRLHVYATKVQEAASTCAIKIEQAEQSNLKERYGENQSTGLYDKARGWFHTKKI